LILQTSWTSWCVFLWVFQTVGAGCHLCNHCCSGKAVSVTYSEYMSVALVIPLECARALLNCHLWPVWLYHIFPHYLIKDTTLEKSYEYKIVCFSTAFAWITSHSKNWARYYHIFIYVFMKSIRYSCQILMPIYFSRQIFETLKNQI
jgi:hypothetical protein